MKLAGALQDDLQTGKPIATHLAAAVICARGSLSIALAAIIHNKRNIL
jgi:hypothetical protein